MATERPVLLRGAAVLGFALGMYWVLHRLARAHAAAMRHEMGLCNCRRLK